MVVSANKQVLVVVADDGVAGRGQKQEANGTDATAANKNHSSKLHC